MLLALGDEAHGDSGIARLPLIRVRQPVPAHLEVRGQGRLFAAQETDLIHQVIALAQALGGSPRAFAPAHEAARLASREETRREPVLGAGRRYFERAIHGRSPVVLRLATRWVCVLDFLDPGSECKAQDSIRVAGLVEPRNLLERIPFEDVLDRRVIEGRGSRGGRPHSGQTSVIGSGVDQRT